MTRAFLGWLIVAAGVVFAVVYFFEAVRPMPGVTLGLILTTVGILILATRRKERAAK